MNKKAKIKISMIVIILLLVLSFSTIVLSENNEINEDYWDVTNTTFFIGLSGNDQEIPIEEDYIYYFNHGWHLQPLELDPLHTQTWTIIDENTLAMEVDYPNQEVAHSTLTLCLFDDEEQRIMINNIDLQEPEESEFCPDARSWTTEIIPNQQYQIQFQRRPTHFEIWTGNGGGGGGLPICEGMSLSINLVENEIVVSEDFETQLKGVTIGPEAGCSIDVLWWETNQTGTWKQIPTLNQSVPLDCNNVTCKENNPDVDTWYDREIMCHQSGIHNVRGKMQYDKPFNKNLITTSSIKLVTCNANESIARQAIEEGITNSVLSSPETETDQQVYIRYLNNDQSLGSFDKFVSEGNQTWVFNYVTTNESYTNISSLGNIVNVWENESLTYSEIVNQVESFINSTFI